ncbi:MAG: hypothetical protein ACLU3N_09990 [Lachnospiraceae bacterium]
MGWVRLWTPSKRLHISTMVTVGRHEDRKEEGYDKITEIAVVDDGCGMNKGTLHRCRRWGMIRAHGGKLGFGFGVGMTPGGISLQDELRSIQNHATKALYTFIT